MKNSMMNSRCPQRSLSSGWDGRDLVQQCHVNTTAQRSQGILVHRSHTQIKTHLVTCHRNPYICIYIYVSMWVCVVFSLRKLCLVSIFTSIQPVVHENSFSGCISPLIKSVSQSVLGLMCFYNPSPHLSPSF